MKRILTTVALYILACILIGLGANYCSDFKTDADELNEGIKEICQEQCDHEKEALEYADSIIAIADDIADEDVSNALIEAAEGIRYALTDYNYEDALLELVKDVDP